MLRFILKFICYIPYKLIFWTKWINKKELRKYSGKPVIFAMNHRNGFDGPTLIVDIFRKSNFWIKGELFKKKFNRWFFKNFGGIPVTPDAELTLMRDSQKVFKNNHA